MSVALIIKNTILVVLIILIGHFMVKNILIERVVKKPEQVVTKPVDINHELGGSLTPIKSNIAPSPIVPATETPIAKPSSDASKAQGGLDKAKEELLKFIDDEDEEDMNRFFGNTTSLTPLANDNCKAKIQDMMLPLNTSCDQSVRTLQSTDKTVKASSKFLQDKKNVVLINSYENESTMNGGDLFGGLSAFDASDNNFEQLV